MRRLIILFILALSTGAYINADEVSFTASAPSAVVTGEQFRLSYTLNAEGTDIRIPELPDFEVLMGPSTSTAYSSTFINGKTSSETTVTFTYILMPKKEGTFNIGPGSIKVKGRNYTSNALVIKVLPPDKSGNSGSQGSGRGGSASSSGSVSSNDVFVRMIVSKQNVYEQEGFLVTFKLYSIDGQVVPQNFKFPEFDGFLVQEIELPQEKQWSLENYNGRNYQSVVLRQCVLYPQRSGNIRIESGRFDAIIRIRTEQKARSLFDDFFGTYQDVKKVLTTTPVTIDVKPLPAGKPASFSGAVGIYSMTSTINTTNLKTNEAVTLKLAITGSGNIKLLKNPEVVFPNDFEVYDPKVDNKISTTAAGTQGSKTIEYTAIPRYAGDFEIPPVSFSYFDIKSGTYKTITTQSYKLHVEKGVGGEGGGPIVSNFSDKERVKFLGKDIRYLKVKGFSFVPNNEIFFGSFIYLFSYILITILFIVFFIIYRKQVKENANIALVRTRKANKIALKRLKKADQLLQENKKEEFYEEILRALWGYLSDKLNMPQSELTKDNIENELTKSGINETLIHEFMDILNTCEFARYAPNQASDAMGNLFKQTVDAIDKMENTIKK
ncbi:BatD family protein [Parabacteroides sp. Marseille-P3160]|uniref:BatD family protein n=1 Tax=Parabacteroides sp. Marseille-P3160 TaxID=1917887 RepID=UPI0009BBC67B|nr:BatD family protein [Parabacteroides sp. Marseille-P3160]